MDGEPGVKIRSALLSVVLTLAASGLLVTPGRAQDPPVIPLDGDGNPLRTQFNADMGKVRVLALLSPTCGDCLRGARDLQRDVMDQTQATGLAMYIVWVPLEGARERHARRATRLVPDRRARHFWDGEDRLTQEFGRTLDIDTDAWDVFLVYGPDATWEEGDLPPAPDYWQHELFRLRKTAPRFDSAVLLSEVRARLPGR